MPDPKTTESPDHGKRVAHTEEPWVLVKELNPYVKSWRRHWLEIKADCDPEDDGKPHTLFEEVSDLHEDEREANAQLAADAPKTRRQRDVLLEAARLCLNKTELYREKQSVEQVLRAALAACEGAPDV